MPALRADGAAFQRARRTNLELGGCSGLSHRRRASASRSRRPRMERRGASRQDGHQLATDLYGLLRAGEHPRAVRAGRQVLHRRHLRAQLRRPVSPAVATALIDSATLISSNFRTTPASTQPSGASSHCSHHSHARASPGRHSGRGSRRCCLTRATKHERSPPHRANSGPIGTSSSNCRRCSSKRRRSTSLGDKPLVLSADRDQQRGWATAQAKLAELSSNSVHRIAGGPHTALCSKRSGSPRSQHEPSPTLFASPGSGQPLR